MSLLAQSVAVARVNVMGLASRPGSALVVVLGVACVVGVMLSVLSIVAGLQLAARSGTDPRNVIVLATDALGEGASQVSRDACSTLLQAPGLAHGPDGRAILDCEILQSLHLEGFAGGMLYVRGVGARASQLYPDFKITSGHAFRPGIHELLVGAGAQAVFKLKVGDTVIMPDGEWPIVGSFSSGGGMLESQLLADGATLTASTRGDNFNSVLVQLEKPDRFAAFSGWIAGNPALAVAAEPQVELYRRSVGGWVDFYTSLAFFIATILALGALLGSINVLYGRVRARTQEIVTLRIFGFGAAPIAVSVLVEALLLALLGALIGSACAWLLVNGRRSIVVSTAFQFSLNAHFMLVGFAWAAVIALAGSILPALRAVRVPITAGLRA